MSEQSEYYNKKYHEKFKEVSEQLQQVKQENEELKKKLETATDNIIATLEVAAKAITELNQIKETMENEE